MSVPSSWRKVKFEFLSVLWGDSVASVDEMHAMRMEKVRSGVVSETQQLLTAIRHENIHIDKLDCRFCDQSTKGRRLLSSGEKRHSCRKSPLILTRRLHFATSRHTDRRQAKPKGRLGAKKQRCFIHRHGT